MIIMLSVIASHRLSFQKMDIVPENTFYVKNLEDLIHFNNKGGNPVKSKEYLDSDSSSFIDNQKQKKKPKLFAPVIYQNTLREDMNILEKRVIMYETRVVWNTKLAIFKLITTIISLLVTSLLPTNPPSSVLIAVCSSCGITFIVQIILAIIQKSSRIVKMQFSFLAILFWIGIDILAKFLFSSGLKFSFLYFAKVGLVLLRLYYSFNSSLYYAKQLFDQIVFLTIVISTMCIFFRLTSVDVLVSIVMLVVSDSILNGRILQINNKIQEKLFHSAIYEVVYIQDKFWILKFIFCKKYFPT